MKKNLIKYLVHAYQGYFVWRKIIRVNHLGIHDYVLAMDDNAACNYAALKYIDIFKEEREINNLILVTANTDMLPSPSEYSSKIANVQIISKEEWEKFVDFYTIFTTEERIRIISLDKPFGRNAESVIGLKGLTLEEIVCIGMLGLEPEHCMKEKEDN